MTDESGDSLRTVRKKFEIEAALKEEHEEIQAGRLKDESPVELGLGFKELCEACRRGDLRVCQEKIQEGVNINARDTFDYTPLILVSNKLCESPPRPNETEADRDASKASLCGHYEVVQHLLEAGALCERDTFQGERALYNALTDKIRSLLLSYDYSKSRDPLQPLASHVNSLLYREEPATSDITLTANDRTFRLHKFILSARSPYFASKLKTSPDTVTWKAPQSIPSKSIEIALQAVYLGEVTLDITGSHADSNVLAGIEKLAKHLEMGNLIDTIFENDRRKARQRRSDEVERGRDQLAQWFQDHVLKHRLLIDLDAADKIRWDRQNTIFADVLLCAAEEEDEEAPLTNGHAATNAVSNAIPIGLPNSNSAPKSSRKATIFPAHRAMLLRSDYFAAMFSSGFRESQPSDHLPVIHVDCIPAVLEIVLSHLYTERATIPLPLAISTLFAADLLFIERLKVNAATIISTLGNGTAAVAAEADNKPETSPELLDDPIDIFDVVRAGWDTRMPRLEEFGARYLAYRLERYIDDAEFADLVRESAARIKARQETDTIELVDDIRYYLDQRFRLRFEDVGFDVVEDEDGQTDLDGLPGLPGHDAKQEPAQGHDAAAGRHGGNGSADAAAAADSDEPDEFDRDAQGYRLLLGKIDGLLARLELDA